MKDDSSFNVAFVRMVRQYPMLYDNTVLCSKEDKERAWQTIAEHFEETVSNCVERWRNIRTSMGRSLKHCYQLTGSSRTYRKPYYLAKHLEFLVPFMSHRERRPHSHRLGDSAAARALILAEEDVEAEEEEEDEGEGEGDPLYEADSPPETKPLLSASPTDEMLLQVLREGKERLAATRQQSSPSPHKDAATTSLGPYKEPPDEEPQPAKRRRLDDVDDDADWAFLRSLLPDLKVMAPADKLSFKISLLTSINSILYPKSA